jgi:hypothetical protein
MPRAFMRRNNDLRAEADLWATNLFRFCAVHPKQE